MRRLVILGTALLGLAASGRAAVWYVGPEGSRDNAGTQESPWDIASCLNGGQKVAAGDTICLFEGTYRRRPKELFEVRLTGTADKPIHVRPHGRARVRIDGGLEVHAPSAHVWMWGLEIFVSEANPVEPVEPGSHPASFTRPWGGLHMHGGRNCKYINLIIHDTRQAISCWKGEIDPEIYGCIMYDNGWLGTDRGHGHCIYTQNEEGVKTISDCIMTCRYSGTYTMHAYGSSNAYVDNFLVANNIAYGRGPFLIGGGRPSRGIRVMRNYLHGVDMVIGYNAPHNEDCEIRDNLVVNSALDVRKYRSVTQSGNLVYGKGGERPKETRAVLLPNRYDPRRAHVAVFNFGGQSEVRVDVTGFLRDGDRYRIVHPERMYGNSVSGGVCADGAITIPAEGEFSVYVVLRQ